jgi:hypothetical protein
MGMSLNECSLWMDKLELERLTQLRTFTRPQSLLQLHASNSADTGAELADLLRDNARLRRQNRALRAASASSARSGPVLSGLKIDESTQGGPPAAAVEAVPATVSVPPPGPKDFNGATAIIARLPAGQGGFTASLLDTEGVEKRSLPPSLLSLSLPLSLCSLALSVAAAEHQHCQFLSSAQWRSSA